MTERAGWLQQIVPEGENRASGAFLVWTTLFVVVGTFVWSVAFGLAWYWTVGESPLLTQGGTDFSTFDVLLYLTYAIAVGIGIGWRAPRPAGLHGLIIALVYVAVFFGRKSVYAPGIVVSFVLVVAGISIGLGWFLDSRAPRTGE